MFNKNNACSKTISILIVLFFAVSVPSALAQESKEKEGEKYLSRGEVAVMLSATDFMKEKIGQLLNFTVGYALPTFNRATLAPILKYIKVVPDKVSLDKSQLFKLLVAVDNPGGLSEIEDVRLDAASLGKPLGLKMVDNGLWGDDKANDGIYTLQDTISKGLDPGEKEITISVVNKKGWMSIARTDVIVENPNKQGIDINISIVPQKIKAGKETKIMIMVVISGAIGDDSNVKAFVDLSALGGPSKVGMKKSGKIFALEAQFKAPSEIGARNIPIRLFDSNGNFIDRGILIEITE